jgi:hypothetical protein
MKVLIVHHHLQTGGVTSVIDTQCKALMQEGIEVNVMVGDACERTPGGLTPLQNPLLSYLPKDMELADFKIQLQQLVMALREQCGADTILHVHNLNLGKNPLLNLACEQLSRSGMVVVNHCHDFAEDNRPQNMEHLERVILDCSDLPLAEVLYPKVSPYQYIIINQRDQKHLETQGVTTDRICHVPNAIPVPVTKDPVASHLAIIEQLNIADLPIVLYPVRAIARKNIGELILIASLFKGQYHFCITQPPQNPSEIPVYESWKSYCQEEGIPVQFEVGQTCCFETLMSAADRVISTSMNEGFGMGFLEPWLWGKPVVGRDLPLITEDFKRAGVRFTGFYEELEVDCLDFCFFKVTDQMKFISATRKKPELTERIIAEFGLNHLFKPVDTVDLEHNQEVIQHHYSISSYGTKLKSLYAASL